MKMEIKYENKNIGFIAYNNLIYIGPLTFNSSTNRITCIYHPLYILLGASNN